MPKFQRLKHDELSPHLQGVIGPNMPPAKRIALAKGLIPLGTKDLLLALYFLAGDLDRQVAREAQKSLKDLPESLTILGLSGKVSPKLLHFVATQSYDNFHIHEQIALHRQVREDTLIHLGRHTEHERVIGILAGNERAILRCPSILHGLARNPRTPQSTVDRLTKFYEIDKGHSYREDLPPELRAETERPAPQPKPEIKPEPEAEAGAPLSDRMVFPDERLHPCVRLGDLAGAEFDSDLLFADDLMHEPDDDDGTAEGPSEQQARTMMARIARMKMIDKLLLAMRGNAEARKILIKNPNRLIQEGVLQNPRVRVREVIEAVKERSTSQNVVERICNNREWTRYYEVCHQLCWHPKTPARMVFRYLSKLNFKDLNKIARSRNVPGATRNQALKMAQRRGSSR